MKHMQCAMSLGMLPGGPDSLSVVSADDSCWGGITLIGMMLLHMTVVGICEGWTYMSQSFWCWEV